MISNWENVMPVMTGYVDKATGVTVSANREIEKAWQAFDGNLGTRWIAEKGSWIKVDLVKPYAIRKINANFTLNIGSYQLNLKIEGSKDDINWDSLFQLNGYKKEGDIHSFEFDNKGKYRFYKITLEHPLYGYVGFRELELLQDLNFASAKYLLKQGNQYYSIKSELYNDSKFQPITELQGKSSLSKDDYNNFGIEDLNLLTQNMTVGTETFRPIDKFTGEVEIYKYEEV